MSMMVVDTGIWIAAVIWTVGQLGAMYLANEYVATPGEYLILYVANGAALYARRALIHLRDGE